MNCIPRWQPRDFVTFQKSVKPADVGASNRLRMHAHLGNPRRLLASTFRPFVQRQIASDSSVSLGDVSAAAMDAVIVGIDPSAHGAIAVLNAAGQLLDVIDMPSTLEANGRTATNAPLLAGILARTHARVAFCEFVGARPTDAKVAAFAFGRARGVIEGCAGALGLPIVFSTPPTWKRLADIPSGAENKDLARTRAIARWPAHADLFARKRDVDRAEACLIALAGLMRETRT
jgi:crossover junction endodeoxyribonuclease RuvC